MKRLCSLLGGPKLDAMAKNVHQRLGLKSKRGRRQRPDHRVVSFDRDRSDSILGKHLRAQGTGVLLLQVHLATLRACSPNRQRTGKEEKAFPGSSSDRALCSRWTSASRPKEKNAHVRYLSSSPFKDIGKQKHRALIADAFHIQNRWRQRVRKPCPRMSFQHRLHRMAGRRASKGCAPLLKNGCTEQRSHAECPRQDTSSRRA